jgi:uncharacterized NAD-dependent epimerase/dehydratase family protein
VQGLEDVDVDSEEEGDFHDDEGVVVDVVVVDVGAIVGSSSYVANENRNDDYY